MAREDDSTIKRIIVALATALWRAVSTPRSAVGVAVGLALLVAIIYPPAISWAIGRILLALSPLISLLIVGLLICSAFRMILPKGSKRGDH